MLRRSGWVLAAGTLLVAASAGGQEADAVRLLAWVHTPDGYRTLQFRSAGAPRITRGLLIGTPAGVVRLRIEEVVSQASFCEWDTSLHGPVPTDSLRRRRLVATRGRSRTVLLDVAGGDGLQDANDTIIVLASMGPYLAVERRSYSYFPCSAHGDGVRTFHWFDLRDGSSVQIGAHLGTDLSRVEAALRERFRQAVASSGEDPSHWEANAGPFQTEGVVPVHDGRGWSTEIHVLLGVPYAWTDGHTAYAMESSLTVPELPPLLRQYRRVPPRVLRFLRASPRHRLGGVSMTGLRRDSSSRATGPA